MTLILRPEVTVAVDGAAPIRPTGGNLSIAAMNAPYATATVDLSTPPDELLEALDPRTTPPRVILTGTATGEWVFSPPDENTPPVWVPNDPRPFNLGLRARVIDHARKTVTLQLASDEALLTDYATLVEDTGAFAHQGSLRGIVNYVLARIGAQLAPGGPDAPFPVVGNSTNMLPDPGTAGTPEGGYAAVRCSLNLNDTTWSISGDGDSFNLYAPASADSFLGIGTGSGGGLAWAMRAGRTYIFSATGRVKVAVAGADQPRSRRLVVFYRGPGSVYTEAMSARLPTTVGTVTRVSVQFTLPANAEEAFIRVYHGHTAGEMQWDGFRLSEKDPTPGYVDTGYFDGDTLDTAQAIYNWTGTQDASPSERVSLTGAPELLVWRPGVTAWDFLAPLTSLAGLRLFCDELRVWRLIDPATYTVPGAVILSGENAVEGTDTIGRDDPEVFATGVVCRYTWQDAAGNTRTATDTAGTPEKVVVIDYTRPYPGPGAAAEILRRRNGRGRTQDVTAVTQWSTTPGMTASVTLPNTLEQIGRVDAVQWRLDDTALMSVGTRELVDAPPGSWLDLDPALLWQDVPRTVTWETITPTQEIFAHA